MKARTSLIGVASTFLIAGAASGALIASFNEGNASGYTGTGPAGVAATAWVDNTFIGVIDPGSGLSYRLVSGWGIGIGLNSGGANFASPMTNTFSVGNGTGTIEISNLDPSKIYDLYVIAGNAEGFAPGNVYGGIYTVSAGTGGSAGATGGTQADVGWVNGQNYVRLGGVLPDPAGVVQIEATPNSNSPNYSIAGIQVVAIPEPSSAILFGLGAACLLFRRCPRRRECI